MSKATEPQPEREWAAGGLSKALDITALEFSNTSFDMYNAWRSNQPMDQQRGYLAIWAGLRIYCKTVLTNTFNSAHHDHIHADNDANGVSAPPAIRTTAHTDTAFVANRMQSAERNQPSC